MIQKVTELTKRIHVTIPDSLALAIEKEYHRLHQELIKMKEAGIYPKGKRLTQTSVRAVVIELGLEHMKELDYDQFEQHSKEHK